MSNNNKAVTNTTLAADGITILHDLPTELNRIAKVANSDDAKNKDQFVKFYNVSKAAFADHIMQWRRFDTFEEFRDAMQGLLYTTLFYSAVLTRNESGISEHTGYTDDYTHAYSWWRIQEAGIQPFPLDGAIYDTEVSLFEIRQSLEREKNYYEVRVRVAELVNMRFTELYVP